MNRYTIYCTEEQTRKALELGAPIEILPNYTEYRVFPFIKCKDGNDRPCIIPTAEQMIGWLEEQGVFISVSRLLSCEEYSVYIYTKKGRYYERDKRSLTRGEATLSAIDAALEYLENLKQ